MSPRLDSIETDQALPKRAGVVVIGGGVIGVSTALALAEKGADVTLVEKGRVGGEQSSRNWGWCRAMGRDLSEVPLAVESLRLWDTMASRVGRDVGFKRAGAVWLCDKPSEMGKHEAWLERSREYQLDSRLLSAEETASLLPGAGRRFAGALFTPTDGRAEPEHAVPAMAAAARRLGAVIVEGCAARGVDLTAGRVSGVVTERGRIAADAVVLAGGAWSRLFCGNHGVAFPQLKVLGSVFRTEPLAGPEFAVGGNGFAFRRRADGGYTVARRNWSEAQITPDSFRLFRQFAPQLLSPVRKEMVVRLRPSLFWQEARTPRRWSLDAPTPFEEIRVLDPKPSRRSIARASANLIAAFPGFAGMRIAESWAGLIDVTPDGVPVISPVAALPGFHLASGFSGHGFGIGPGAGRLMADIITGATPIVDPHPFRLERLAA